MITDRHTISWDEVIAIQPAAVLLPEVLRGVATRVEAAPRDILFRIGDPVRYIYLVIAGEARLIRAGRHGGDVILQRSRGGFIAEASLESKVYHCDAVATESSILLRLPADAFLAALDHHAAFRKAWQAHLAGEIRKLRAQCERLSLPSAFDRVIHYIESEGTDGSVTLKQTRKAWAAELGLSHEALYRALRRMRDNGTLTIEGNRLSQNRRPA